MLLSCDGIDPMAGSDCEFIVIKRTGGSVDRRMFDQAIDRYVAGERPYEFKRPNWLLVAEDGSRYPLKYIFCMAAQVEPRDTHTHAAKIAAENAGFEVVNSDVTASAQAENSAFWWVNHKQTHQDEYSGGYIWSPKTKRNGIANETYQNLTKALPGDRIISYADGYVKAIGVVTRSFAEATIPKSHWEAAEWQTSGWEVLVEWLPLPTWLKPKKFINRIAPLLPGKHSPLQQNGDGNQGCYLAAISYDLGQLIIALAIEVDASAAQVAHELNAESREAVEEAHLVASDLTVTEKEQLTRARIGQGVFRQRVGKVEKCCRLTGVENVAFLVASHIKPWRFCNNEERLSGSNGLFLSPHVDKLFDRGWISFSDEGALLVAGEAEAVVAAWHLPREAIGPAFSAAQRRFLDYHRTHIFVSSSGE